eukprot:TRINITY_DN17745_c0_g1_i2.p1 TRINITY_DN17745_c0_g1~~TRINITY_DN17745_c0_g1_i2.p1  ORF type:complete len:570 (+),score=156.17 TRINITY_DN17745_c0_g1_i2:235-1710(+)
MDSSDDTLKQFVSNERCYEHMGKPMLELAMKGYNVCLFCYGQTGTGKTTTIMGDAHVGKGLLPQLLEDLFKRADEMRSQGASVDLNLQMMEVYNETIHDLLIPKEKREQGKGKVETHVLPAGVLISGAETIKVERLEDCMRLIDVGNGNRVVATTEMNPQSSRGHSVIKLTFVRSGGEDHTVLSSEIYFADLAGHENERLTKVKGEHLKELSYINSSLMWLQNCIHAVGEAGEKNHSGRRRSVCMPRHRSSIHAPDGSPNAARTDLSKFRNSKLTLLLANAMTGNSCTAVIVTLSPAAGHYETSLSSLKFAAEVKGIKMEAKANVQQEPPDVIIKRLQDEITELRQHGAAAEELENLRARERAALSREEALREELAETKRQLQKEHHLRKMSFYVASMRAGSSMSGDFMKGIVAQLSKVHEIGEVNEQLLAEHLNSYCDARFPGRAAVDEAFGSALPLSARPEGKNGDGAERCKNGSWPNRPLGAVADAPG